MYPPRRSFFEPSSARRGGAIVLAAGLLAAPLATAGAATAAPATPKASSASTSPDRDARLTPRTHFFMEPDGSSGLYARGDGIPNIDSVKKTIAEYYGDPGTGIANKNASPYINEVGGIVARESKTLKRRYERAVRHGKKPALVFDSDDTTLSTYDFEVAGVGFNFDPKIQDEYVQAERFPATPAMVAYVNEAHRIGYTIFGLTGRNDDQKKATLKNLKKVGYTAFTSKNFYTKWTGKGKSQQPKYVKCAVAKCTTVEFKAMTRKHIEKDRGFDIVASYGDQFSDLKGGYADRTVKLPNPTYYLPSPNLPGLSEPRLEPKSRFAMEPDGTSGRTVGGENIPNIDSVKKTIATYYGDPGTGISDKVDSPYIREMSKIVDRQKRRVVRQCRAGVKRDTRPAIVLDADDTTLSTYDFEVAGVGFNFDPKVQDEYVQAEKFPATPRMVGLEEVAKNAGCTIVGLTGRNDDQKRATLKNLKKVGYTGFTAKNYYTKWTGEGTSQQPEYIKCAAAKCTTVEYKSQTRKHIEAGRKGYDIVANFGDQFSDLKGGYAKRTVKLPNPTYYLP